MAAFYHVLLLGGHGKIAQFLTPLLLKRSWTVPSVIRHQDQVPAVESLGTGLPGQLSVLVSSIEEVDSQDKAASIINKVNPDYVVWSAGAGGKYGDEATYRIDRDAAIHFVNAAAATPSIARFLLVSYNGSRRKGAAWWPAGEWDDYEKNINYGTLATYYQAKIAADEVFYEAARKSSTMVGISLRPGLLSDSPKGKITLGKNEKLVGTVSRETVAHVADAILAAEGVKSGWLDLLQGDEDIEVAVANAIRDGVDAAEGEPIYAKNTWNLHSGSC